MDGTFTTMALTENTKVRDVVRYMCRQHALNNESEWGLLEFWDHPGIHVRLRVSVGVLWDHPGIHVRLRVRVRVTPYP